MEDLLFGFITIYMLCLIPLGAIQLLISLFKILQRGMPAAYYNDLKKYWFYVAVYFSVWLAGYLIDFEFYNSTPMFILVLCYFSLIPTLIAIYNIIILKREYPQEIEKLIF